ncbi:hypothetical protein RIF29_21521 [Crotalaria pallida]|uniref:Senescence-associated carboxylesterase 101-like n=1 Tax=Crotalaria pallida TaxID=3830 RepID=A0AAN9F347_CROPI
MGRSLLYVIDKIMKHYSLFPYIFPISPGFQLASLVNSSGLVRIAWNAITCKEIGMDSEEGVKLSWKVDLVTLQGKDLKIIVFETIPPAAFQVDLDLVSSSDLKKKYSLDFDFLCTERIPHFSVNKSAVSLLHQNRHILAQLKTEINSSFPLIITGRGLAGAVASLFSLSLLDTIRSIKNRPLCITFGSPLIGDRKFQTAISRSSTWNSCFLNVVSHKDPLPRLFIANQSAYHPFGTFILCSDAGSTSSENSEFILELLVAIASTHVQNQEFQYAEYGNIVENLYRKAIFKDVISAPAENMDLSDSLIASINFRLCSLGLTPHMQDINFLKKMLTLEKKFIIRREEKFDPSRKLNVLKRDMAVLEWYKRKCKMEGVGYYDSYRNMHFTCDFDASGIQKNLNHYWRNMVEEAEMKPMIEGAALRTVWLYAGTMYRRMVEPLVIADYYREGGKDYVTKERSKHFDKLEEWLKETYMSATGALNRTRKHNVESILTLDSCFWSHVEEALISCKQFKSTMNEEARNELIEFEEYVYQSLKSYAVSPDIFLPKTSYMRWWNEYKEIMGNSYDSKLASFMSNANNYKEYAAGAFDFD